MSYTKVEEINHGQKIGSKISIRPYVDENAKNMGLEKYDMSVFEGVRHEESVACLELNGVKRYVTGLNEFAPEVKNLPPDQKEAKVKQIRETVSQLEKELAGNIIDVNDKDFWNKVVLLKPNNSIFWEKLTIRPGNDPIYLDPVNDPNDLLKVTAIEAGGFSMIASSLEIARKTGKFKWYLDKVEETATIKTELKKLRNKALAELEKMFNKNQNKLFYVCKVIDANPTIYKKSTPNDIMYDNMDNYINGNAFEKNKKKAAENFITISSLDMEVLKLRAIIQDSHYYKFITLKADGFIYHAKTNTMLGKNPSEILEFLKNPLNEEILTDLTKSVEYYWS